MIAIALADAQWNCFLACLESWKVSLKLTASAALLGALVVYQRRSDDDDDK